MKQIIQVRTPIQWTLQATPADKPWTNTTENLEESPNQHEKYIYKENYTNNPATTINMKQYRDSWAVA